VEARPAQGQVAADVHGTAVRSPQEGGGRVRGQALPDAAEVDPHPGRSVDRAQIGGDDDRRPGLFGARARRAPRGRVGQRGDEVDGRPAGARARVAAGLQGVEQGGVDQAAGAVRGGDCVDDGLAEVRRDADGGRRVPVERRQLAGRVEAGERGGQRLDAGARRGDLGTGRVLADRVGVLGEDAGRHAHRGEPLVEDDHPPDVPVEGLAGWLWVEPAEPSP